MSELERYLVLSKTVKADMKIVAGTAGMPTEPDEAK